MKKFIQRQNVILLFFVSAAVVLVIMLLSGQMMYRSAEMIEETSSLEMLALSRAAALITTADELDEYVLPSDMEKEGYITLKDKLIIFTQQAGLEFTYYMRLDPQTNLMSFVIDNTPGNFTALIEEPVAREPSPDLALQGQANTVPLGSYSEGWAGYLTAFAPVYYSDGSPSNYVAGVDIKDIYIKEARDNVFKLSAVLVISLVIVLSTCLLCLLLYRKKARQAEEASLSKSTFLSNMSHEMRTPMNAIIGMTEIAKTSSDPTQIQYCLSRINDAAGHLLGVINDVLDISKIEAGKFTLSPTTFPLEDMLQRVVTVVNVKMEEKRQDFIIRVDSDVPDCIVADQQRLAQVVTNLLSNAVKFTGEDGRISLSVHLEEAAGDTPTLRFDVADNGIGISKEQQKRLFASFQQADSSISRRFGGTGLGLSISKNIVESMEGRIWVTSEEGEGSCFSFTAKVQKAPDEHCLQLAGDVPKDIRLLVVDSSSDVRDYFAIIAAKIGIRADFAQNGTDAGQMLEKDPAAYDMVFVEHRPNGTDALAFAQTVRPRFGGCIVAMVPATAWPHMEDEAKKAGVTHYLPKPILPSPVVNSIDYCLSSLQSSALLPGQQSEQGLFLGKRLLLAEDMEINREILIALLGETGVEITSAENGKLAVDLFRQEPARYDLILMDIHMPEMDGYAATRAIRALPVETAASVPIIAMTANVFREDIDRCLAAGMNDHIGKPINLDEVIEKINRYL